MNVQRRKIFLMAVFTMSMVLSSCSISNTRALVVDCPNEKPAEINKAGLKHEMQREKTLDKINARRDKDRN